MVLDDLGAASGRNYAVRWYQIRQSWSLLQEIAVVYRRQSPSYHCSRSQTFEPTTETFAMHGNTAAMHECGNPWTYYSKHQLVPTVLECCRLTENQKSVHQCHVHPQGIVALPQMNSVTIKEAARTENWSEVSVMVGRRNTKTTTYHSSSRPHRESSSCPVPNRKYALFINTKLKTMVNSLSWYILKEEDEDYGDY